MTKNIWQKLTILTWTQLLLDSYEKLVGIPLLVREGNPENQAKSLFFAPFVVLSHGAESDPIFNYGNQMALDLWEITWEDLTKTPSRLTAESLQQEERAQMLAQVSRQGFIKNYQGVRISRTGKRFLLKNATVWNLVDEDGKYCGQGATWQDWSFL